MNKPPTWFWIVSVLALLWAGAGCAAYLLQVGMSPADMAKLPAAQRAIWAMMPEWVMAAYALAVWLGLAGAVALLLRRRIARSLYIVSLAAVIVQFGWTFLATPILTTVGAVQSLPFPLFIVVAGVALIWLSQIAIARGWLR